MAQYPLKSTAFFIILLAITGTFLYTISGLLLPLFYGLVFSVLLYPLYEKIKDKMGGRDGLSVFIAIFIAALVLASTVYVLGSFIVRDAAELVDIVALQTEALSPKAREIAEGLKNLLPGTVSERLNEINLQEQIVTLAKKSSSYLIGGLQTFTGNFLQVLALTLVAFYATFYFLKDGRNWMSHIFRIVPMAEEDERYLATRFLAMLRVSFRMIFIMGAVQGFLGGLIFYILGIAAPFFWGLIFALVSLIPGLGHYLIWIPAAVILFLIGSPIKAVILITYGLLVMALSDDFLRPYLIGKSVSIHPFLILLSTLGGIATFGFTGLILGPVLASLMIACFEIYERSYRIS